MGAYFHHLGIPRGSLLRADGLLSGRSRGSQRMRLDGSDAVNSALAAYWPLDISSIAGAAVSGASVYELTNNLIRGTLAGSPAITAGPVDGGHALSFNGSSQYVDLGAPAALNFPGVVSLAAWVSLGTVATSSQQVIASNPSSPGSVIYQLEVNRTGGRAGFVHGTNGTGFLVATGTVSIPANTWTHICAVRTGTTGSWSVSLYVNGELDNVTTSANNPGPPAAMAIGRAGGANQEYFLGGIYDVRISPAAFIPSHIRRLYRDRSGNLGLSRPTRLIGTAGGAPPPPATSSNFFFM